MPRGRDFYDAKVPGQKVVVGDRAYWLPIYYHDNDVFGSVHLASYEAVAASLPSEVIRPVRWIDGRAIVTVLALRYNAATWRGPDGTSGLGIPYGEVSIAAVVSAGSAPRVLPLLANRAGGCVLHMPVTSRQARDGGRQLFGFPKFLADMDSMEGSGIRQVRVSEAGQLILTLTLHPAGRVALDRKPFMSYSALDGQLLETRVEVVGHVRTRFGSAGGELALGRHEVAEQLRRLAISPSPLEVLSYLDHRSMLPAAGGTTGPARAYLPYPGGDDELAQYTISYPGAPVEDRYAALRTARASPS